MPDRNLQFPQFDEDGFRSLDRDVDALFEYLQNENRADQLDTGRGRRQFVPPIQSFPEVDLPQVLSDPDGAELDTPAGRGSRGENLPPIYGLYLYEDFSAEAVANETRRIDFLRANGFTLDVQTIDSWNAAPGTTTQYDVVLAPMVAAVDEPTLSAGAAVVASNAAPAAYGSGFSAKGQTSGVGSDITSANTGDPLEAGYTGDVDVLSPEPATGEEYLAAARTSDLAGGATVAFDFTAFATNWAAVWSLPAGGGWGRRVWGWWNPSSGAGGSYDSPAGLSIFLNLARWAAGRL